MESKKTIFISRFTVQIEIDQLPELAGRATFPAPPGGRVSRKRGAGDSKPDISVFGSRWRLGG